MLFLINTKQLQIKTLAAIVAYDIQSMALLNTVAIFANTCAI